MLWIRNHSKILFAYATWFTSSDLFLFLKCCSWLFHNLSSGFLKCFLGWSLFCFLKNTWRSTSHLTQFPWVIIEFLHFLNPHEVGVWVSNRSGCSRYTYSNGSYKKPSETSLSGIFRTGLKFDCNRRHFTEKLTYNQNCYC